MGIEPFAKLLISNRETNIRGTKEDRTNSDIKLGVTSMNELQEMEKKKGTRQTWHNLIAMITEDYWKNLHTFHQYSSLYYSSPRHTHYYCPQNTP